MRYNASDFLGLTEEGKFVYAIGLPLGGFSLEVYNTIQHVPLQVHEANFNGYPIRSW